MIQPQPPGPPKRAVRQDRPRARPLSRLSCSAAAAAAGNTAASPLPPSLTPACDLHSRHHVVLDEPPDGLAVCGHDELPVCVYNIVALSTPQVILQQQQQRGNNVRLAR
jgi:hypothetical protein